MAPMPWKKRPQGEDEDLFDQKPRSGSLLGRLRGRRSPGADAANEEGDGHPRREVRPERRRKSRRDPIDDMFDGADEVPVASLEEQRQAGKKAFRQTRRLLMLSPWLTAVVSGIALLFGLAWFNTVGETDQGAFQEVQATEVGRTQAEAALQSWLDAEHSVLPEATITSWDGVSDRLEVPATDKEPALTLLTHNFTVRDSSGVYLRADVRIAHSEGRGAKVVSQPSILPLQPTAVDEWNPEVVPPQWAVTSSGQPIEDAVSAWANALVTSPDELKLVVRDGEGANLYATLPNLTYVSSKVDRAISPADGNGAVKDHSTVVATVTVLYAPADAAEGESSPQPTQVQYDVLIRGADTAAPYVTAWGGVDSGPLLEDYMNATRLSGEPDDYSDSPTYRGPSDGGGEAEPTTDPSDGGS